MRISDWSSDVCSSDLITDESYWAEKNRGAWLHDRRLRVSARRDLADPLIATGIPFFGHGDMAQWSRIFGAVAGQVAGIRRFGSARSEEHTSELQSLMRISYAVFCLEKKTILIVDK